MGVINKIAQKFVKTASIAVTDSVKEEAKNVAISALPTLLGIGVAIAGLVVFRYTSVKTPRLNSVLPAISTTSSVTNNWFLDNDSKAAVLSQLLSRTTQEGVKI